MTGKEPNLRSRLSHFEASKHEVRSSPRNDRIAVISFTENGKKLGRKVKKN